MEQTNDFLLPIAIAKNRYELSEEYTNDNAYLNNLLNNENLSLEQALEKLKLEYGIEYKIYPFITDKKYKYILLNYNQIDTGTKGSRYHLIVEQCRSLVLLYNSEKNMVKIYSNSFSRFFDHEIVSTFKEYPLNRYSLKINQNDNFELETYAMEKMDGSLIRLWYDIDTKQWQFGTRGMLFAEHPKLNFSISKEVENENTDLWRNYLLNVVGCKDLNDLTNKMKDIDIRNTFIFEWCSPLNLHITPQNENKLILLGVSTTYSQNIDKNNNGCFVNSHPKILESFEKKLLYNELINIEKVKTYQVNNMSEVYDIFNKLDGLHEGLVIYQTDSSINEVYDMYFYNYFSKKTYYFDTDIRVKLKREEYKQAFKIKNNGFSKNSIIEAVATFTEKEVAEIFSHDNPLMEALEDFASMRDALIVSTQILFDKTKHIENQKEFALAVKDNKLSSLLFNAKKLNINVLTAWKNARIEYKFNILNSIIK